MTLPYRYIFACEAAKVGHSVGIVCEREAVAQALAHQLRMHLGRKVAPPPNDSVPAHRLMIVLTPTPEGKIGRIHLTSVDAARTGYQYDWWTIDDPHRPIGSVPNFQTRLSPWARELPKTRDQVVEPATSE